MWFCSPWNPAPFPGIPGLFNDPLAPSEKWFNKGAFDWVETPPAYWIHGPNQNPTDGKFLLRSTWNSGGEGAVLQAQLDSFKARFGTRAGERMFFEMMRQEFFWNRNSVGNPNGVGWSAFLYVEFPHPLRVLYAELLEAGTIDGPEDWAENILPTLGPTAGASWFAGTCQPHFSAVYSEGVFPPIIESWTAWFNFSTPSHGTFKPRLYPDGYPVYAQECLELGPTANGRWQGPNPFVPILLPARSKTASGARVLTPAL